MRTFLRYTIVLMIALISFLGAGLGPSLAASAQTQVQPGQPRTFTCLRYWDLRDRPSHIKVRSDVLSLARHQCESGSSIGQYVTVGRLEDQLSEGWHPTCSGLLPIKKRDYGAIDTPAEGRQAVCVAKWAGYVEFFKIRLPECFQIYSQHRFNGDAVMQSSQADKCDPAAKIAADEAARPKADFPWGMLIGVIIFWGAVILVYLHMKYGPPGPKSKHEEWVKSGIGGGSAQ